MFNATTLLANFYYDFRNSSDFTPYVMAGAGLAFIHSEVDYKGWMANQEYKINESDDFTNFAWTLGAGVAYNFNENMAVDLGYRYLNLGSTNVSGSKKWPNNLTARYDADNYAYNPEISLGLRLTF